MRTRCAVSAVVGQEEQKLKAQEGAVRNPSTSTVEMMEKTAANHRHLDGSRALTRRCKTVCAAALSRINSSNF